METQVSRWFVKSLAWLVPAGEGHLRFTDRGAPVAAEAATAPGAGAPTSAAIDPEAADLRVWCFALGFDEAAAALRPLAPHAVADQRRLPARSYGAVDDLVASLRSYASCHPGFAGERAAQALSRAEDARWQ